MPEFKFLNSNPEKLELLYWLSKLPTPPRSAVVSQRGTFRVPVRGGDYKKG